MSERGKGPGTSQQTGATPSARGSKRVPGSRSASEKRYSEAGPAPGPASGAPAPPPSPPAAPRGDGTPAAAAPADADDGDSRVIDAFDAAFDLGGGSAAVPLVRIDKEEGELANVDQDGVAPGRSSKLDPGQATEPGADENDEVENDDDGIAPRR